jgi:hypothetical protein
MTCMRLFQNGSEVNWSYEITDPAEVGRQKNELLAFGYLADLLRRFTSAAPIHAELPGTRTARRLPQDLLGCEITHDRKATLIFPLEFLQTVTPASERRKKVTATICPVRGTGCLHRTSRARPRLASVTGSPNYVHRLSARLFGCRAFFSRDLRMDRTNSTFIETRI